MKKTLCTLFASLVVLVAGQAQAAFNLQVTELWGGNDPNPDITVDWFEITNLGDTAWAAAVDGPIFYDDDSMAAESADPIEEIDSIAVGESVVVVISELSTIDVLAFESAWGGLMPAGTQVGYTAGSGLGGGDDGATIFVDVDMDGADPSDQVDFEGYINADGSAGQSFDPVLGAYSVMGQFGAVGAGPNSNGQFAVGTPGTLPVPEPISLVLAAMALAGAAQRRRK